MINNILPPVLGAVIGYFTNWLAIKMLFLPYDAKYIGKVKLPFTPGLIPKERKKLAKNIANITEEKILNTETIKENLFSKNNKEQIYLLLEQNFYKLKEQNYTVDNILDKIYDDRKKEILNKTEEIILSNISKFIFEERNQNIISDIITEKILEYLDNDQVKDKLENGFINFINSQNTKENISNIKFCDIISNEDISNIKLAIFENMPKIYDYLSDKLENDEKWDKKLSSFIKNIIEENLGTFGGLFLNTDKIYTSIKKNAISYLNNKENQNIIGLKIFEIISLYQNKTFFEIYNMLSENTRNIIKEKATNDSLKKYLNKIKIFDNIINNNLNLKNNINILTKKIIKENISKKVYLIIEKYIKNNKNKIVNLNINIILDKIYIEKFKEKIFNVLEIFINKKGDKILQSISISDMIESKINSFDMATIENLIVSVTKKELNAITIIGGVLGFIIGLIPVILR